ncbi:hypothetical protein DXX93_16430 [Thalassotalea euphylliae]|uniref:Uncharacterized protein n=1 Tax=Thalassotalea euphylliae TaxID=1655234 RepID=A0A3E0TTI1_9GAMM|nr:hypothetical protein [Thalassotalea euphylliae]REL27991.1 hypothetical protein DXX93_16430 [Thalassotalea euphylliae]
MTTTSTLAQRAIELLQQHIKALGYQALVHFELEGCCQSSSLLPAHIHRAAATRTHTKRHQAPQKNPNKALPATTQRKPLRSNTLSAAAPQSEKQLCEAHFVAINSALTQAGIEGKLVSEYWHNQWEYVSLFAGQSPLKEAHNLARAIQLLPELFAQQGFEHTLIKPVVWSGDTGQLAVGSKNIFTDRQRAVHIPNAIQVNVSVLDRHGNNLVAQDNFGEILQRCLLNTSLANSLLYMPEPDAFERLALKDKYGLAQELCSPTDISGGHQGSVALYKERGKHNQPMGVEVLLYDQHNKALVSEQNWQKTARVEHRLGSASTAYNPYVNVAYALANVMDALDAYLADQGQALLSQAFVEQALPSQMYASQDDSQASVESEQSAYGLFAKSRWFAERINRSARAAEHSNNEDRELGEQLTRSILTLYQPTNTIALLTTG